MLIKFGILKIRGKSSAGASMVEYALLVSLIAVVSIGSVTFLGRSVSTKATQTGTCLSGGAGCPTAGGGSGGVPPGGGGGTPPDFDASF